MIYVVSNDKSLPIYTDDDISLAGLDEVIEYFSDKDVIGVDTETGGLDVFLHPLFLIQLGDEFNQFVIDTTTVNIKRLKKLLEHKTIIFHNAKFDLKYLFHNGIYPFKNVYDTFLAERVLTTGYNFHRKSLQACVDRYLKVKLSKEERGLIHKLGALHPRIVRYAALDVKYLESVKNFQEKKLTEYDLMNTISLDNQFVVVLAYVEYCGVLLDKNGWIRKAEIDLEDLNAAKDELNKVVVDLFKHSDYVEPPNLFDDYYSCKINWNSSDQVIPLFKELGVDTLTLDKKTGELKDSLDSKNLKAQKSVHPIIPIYLKYQKCQKLVSTYGMDFLKHINPVTGRIHTNFTQIMNTGRLSSGKDKEDDAQAKVGDVNMQNIPAGKERRFFVPEDGNAAIVADYSGQETRVLAEFANDPEFTKYISDPEKDLHCFVASLVYPELKGLSHKEIKEKHPEKRQHIKPGTFTIPYGGTGYTIAENIDISPEEGERVYREFVEEFPGLNNYFIEAKTQVLRDGYVLMNKTSARKCFVTNFEAFNANKLKLTSQFWDSYRAEKELDSEIFHTQFKPFVSKYFKKKGAIERMGMNYRIQGTSADISKLAGIYLYEWILNNDLWGIVKICVPLHDEYFLEAPIEIADDVGDVLSDSMVRAAEVFCKTIPFKATAVVTDHWAH